MNILIKTPESWKTAQKQIRIKYSPLKLSIISSSFSLLNKRKLCAMVELRIGIALLAVLTIGASFSSAQIDPWVKFCDNKIENEWFLLCHRVILTTASRYIRDGRDYDFTVSSNGLRKALMANFTLTGNTENGTSVRLDIINQQIPAIAFRTFKLKVSLHF